MKNDIKKITCQIEFKGSSCPFTQCDLPSAYHLAFFSHSCVFTLILTQKLNGVTYVGSQKLWSCQKGREEKTEQ